MIDVLPRQVFHDPDPQERRRWERLPIAIPVFVRGRDRNGKDFIEFASALNISAGGMLLVTRRCLSSLTGVKVEIPSAPVPRSGVLSRAARTFKVKVTRDSCMNRCHYVGVKFSRPLAGSDASLGHME